MIEHNVFAGAALIFARYFFIIDLDRHGGDLRAMIWDTSTMSTLHPFEAMLHSLNPSTNLVMLVAHRSTPCVSLTRL